uniref:Zinc finger/thioredoxin putative domain-containing protein n=1 Tax=candidate division WOR-3 bacterium TaxID=2052148 RepID=A0A7V3VUG0_UNCW3
MVVECSNCHSRYNVNEDKIPAGGVKVKCPKCQNIILIKKETAPPPPKVEPPPPPKVEPPPPQEAMVPPKRPAEEPVPPPPKVESTEPVVEQKPSPQPEVIPKPAPQPQVEMSEEDKKWHERARRLAKALASDLVLYNQEKVEQGLRDGTLAQLLGAEIRRSWEYYCQQIPKHIVESTDYFREQLNKIVGKGKEIFK